MSTTISPGQILYLEHDVTRLYVEAIQVLEARNLCWARPLILVDGSLDDIERLHSTAEAHPVDCKVLIDSPDILWPLDKFSLALDTEVLPLLALMHNKEEPPTSNPQRLRQFMNSLWQTQGSSTHANH